MLYNLVHPPITVVSFLITPNPENLLSFLFPLSLLF
jgi:hypothetical protein